LLKDGVKVQKATKRTIVLVKLKVNAIAEKNLMEQSSALVKYGFS